MIKMLTGKVVSNKMTNTVTVLIERKFRHAKYGKVITRHKKLKAHVDGDKPNEGDVVTIREIRPLSKDVNFVVASTVKAAPPKEEKKKAVKTAAKKPVRKTVRRTAKKAVKVKK